MLARVRALAGACGVGLMAMACGCGGSTSRETTRAATAADAAERRSAANVRLPSQVRNVVMNRRYVRLTSCKGSPGGWTAGGHATGAGDRPRAYEVTVYFTDSRATVRGFARTRVRVGADGRTGWTAASTAIHGADGLRCVLVGVA